MKNRSDIWAKIGRNGFTQADAAREMKISRSATSIGYARWKARQAKAAAKLPPGPPEKLAVTGTSGAGPTWGGGAQPGGGGGSHGTFAPTSILDSPAKPGPSSPPQSIDEILAGPGSSAPAKPGPADAAPEEKKAPAAEPVEIDEDAADIGKEILLRVRASMLKTALRYYAKADPNDPAIRELLPPADQAAIKSKGGGVLDFVLTRNPEKTQKIGKLLRGWIGIGIGYVLDSIGVMGTVKMVAERPGGPDAPGATSTAPPLQEEAEEEAEEEPPPFKPAPPKLSPEEPPPFDVGSVLAKAAQP